jgi:hypothetical protein
MKKVKYFIGDLYGSRMDRMALLSEVFSLSEGVTRIKDQ